MKTLEERKELFRYEYTKEIKELGTKYHSSLEINDDSTYANPWELNKKYIDYLLECVTDDELEQLAWDQANEDFYDLAKENERNENEELI